MRVLPFKKTVTRAEAEKLIRDTAYHYWERNQKWRADLDWYHAVNDLNKAGIWLSYKAIAARAEVLSDERKDPWALMDWLDAEEWFRLNYVIAA